MKRMCAYYASLLLLSYAPLARAELLLHYTFDEYKTGTNPVLDRGVAPAADGIFKGKAVRIQDTPGGSLRAALDVSSTNTGDHYVSPGNAEKLNALPAMTVTMWINLRRDAAAGARLVSKGSAFDINIPSGGNLATALKIAFMINNNYSNPSTTFDAYQKWVFVASTWDGATRRYYKGGEAKADTVAQLASTAPYAAAATPSNTSTFRVSSTDLASPRTPPAWIDDVRIYSTALGLEELELVRLEGIKESKGTLISLW